MSFIKIDMNNWERRECFNHFNEIAKSSYSITVNVEITELYNLIKEKGYRLYPTFTWIVTKIINNYKEFKMGYDDKNNLGYYDLIYPDYAVVNERTKIMNSLCTVYSKHFKEFYEQMVIDLELYKEKGQCREKYKNSFIVSCLPWITYSSFTVSNESGYQFLFPMVTWGKYFRENKKMLMPVTLQINHAVADGYHCGLFFNELEEVMKKPLEFLELK